MRRSKTIIVVSAVVVLVLSLAAWGVAYRLSNRVTVVNRSGKMITTFTIEVWGDTYIRSKLDDGQSVGVPIVGRKADSHYRVLGTLADGTTFDHQFGYVTSGYGGERATITVYPGGRVEGKQP